MTFQIPLRLSCKSKRFRYLLLMIAIVGTLTSDGRATKLEPRTQPDQLSIGQVRVGARVEAGFLVRGRDVSNAVDDIDVKLPPFLTLTNVFCDYHRDWRVFVSFVILKPGKYEGQIKVH